MFLIPFQKPEHNPNKIKEASGKPAFLILVLILFLVFSYLAFYFTIDDAYIFYRYARNLALNGELTWNIGESPPVEGYTSPLWVALCSLIFLFFDDAGIIAIKILGIIFSLITLGITYLIGCNLYQNRYFALSTVLLLAITSPFVLWSVSGMESPLYLMLIAILFYLILLEEDQHTLFVATPLILFLIAITRTEGGVFYLAITAVRLLYWVRLKNACYSLRNIRYLMWHGVFFTLSSIYICWKLYYYGSLLPLPVYVKKLVGLQGLFYVGSFILYKSLPLFLLALASFRNSNWRKSAYIWAVLGAYLTIISLSHPIMGLFERLVLPAIPLVTLLAILGLQQILNALDIHKPRWIAICVITLILLSTNGNPIHYAQHIHNIAQKRNAVINTVHLPLGEWLEQNMLSAPDNAVALADAGATAYKYHGTVVDFIGLNDIDIARNGFDVQRFLRRSPRMIILKSESDDHFSAHSTNSEYLRISNQIYNTAEFKQNYRFIRKFSSSRPFYSLWVFERVTPSMS